MFRTILLLIGGMLISLAAQALPAAMELDANTAQAWVYPHIAIAQDPTGHWRVADAARVSEHFQADWHYHPQIGYTTAVYWARFDIHNSTAQNRNGYVLFRGQYPNTVQAYAYPSAAVPPVSLAPLQAIDSLRMPAYYLDLAPYSRVSVYLRVQNPNIPLSFEVEFNATDYLLLAAIHDYLFYGIVLGGMLALAAYNLLTYFKLTEISFLSLAFFIVFVALELSRLTGLLHVITLFQEHYLLIQSVFAYAAIASGAHFFHHLMSLPKQLPYFVVPLRLVFWGALLSILLNHWFAFGAWLTSLLGFFLLSIIVPATLTLWRRGLREAKSFAWASSIVTLSSIPLILVGFGLVHNLPYAIDIMHVGMLAFMILLSLSQAERTRILHEQTQRAEATSKAKGEFLASMSHELRTPMNAVIGTGTLLQTTPLNPQQQEYVDRLDTAANHMLNLINDILDLARLENTLPVIESHPFTLGELLENLEKLLHEHAQQKGLTLKLHSDFSLQTPLLGDLTRLSQILLNLLNNALKFTATGSVSLAIRDLGADATGKVLLHFDVTDTGIGIDPTQQAQLFEPFSATQTSTDKRFKGTGLGLSISHKLVAAMGGTLAVSSTPKQGSRFFFSLDFDLARVDTPCSVSQQDDIAVMKRLPTATTYRILLVDDDELNLFFGRALLKTLHVDVETADSGAAALQQLQQHTIDLVLMDVSMPEMNGYETTQRIRADARFTHLPIIALTAHAIAGERERCLAAGMNDYLTKPFVPATMQVMLERWLPHIAAP